MIRRFEPASQFRAASVAGLVILMLIATSGLLSAEEATVASIQAATEDCIRRVFSEMGDVEIQHEGELVLGDLEGMDLEIRPRLVRRVGSSGPVVVALEFWKDGEKLDQRTASARVRVFQDVVVAAQRLDRHTLVEPEAARFERRDIRTLGDQVVTSLEEITGKRARRMLPEGKVILASDLEDIPIIQRGEKILVVTNLGGITVTATATALENGFEGEVISVKNDRSGKRLRGFVLAQGLVRVDIAGRQGVGR